MVMVGARGLRAVLSDAPSAIGGFAVGSVMAIEREADSECEVSQAVSEMSGQIGRCTVKGDAAGEAIQDRALRNYWPVEK